MKIINAFIIAFSMYSKIPMPNAKWEDENMKYSFCFLPLIGALIGALLIGLKYLCNILELSNIIFAAFATYLPILITGGLHMDGFCDTIDALSSHQSPERKLEIMKDSNSGAFAIIKSVIYFMLYFSLLTQITYTGIFILSVGYILSRELAGLSIINLKCAKGSGLAAAFSNAAHKKNVTIILIIMLIFTVTGMIAINQIIGGVAAAVSLILYFCYKNMAYREFKGITGDTTGYFLQICEISICFSVIIAEGVLKLWN